MKLRSFPLFWVALGLYAVLIPLMFNFFLATDLHIEGENVDLAEFLAPTAESLWRYVLFVGSYGVYVLILLMLSFTNRDITNGLWRQYIIEGVNRRELYLTKAALIFLLSVAATLLVLAVGWIVIAQQGYEGVGSALSEISMFLVGYLTYFFTFLMMAFFINLILKSTTTSFLLVAFWGLFVETIVRWLDPTTITQLLPVNNLNKLVPNPFSVLVGGEVTLMPELVAFMLSLMWLVIFMSLSAYIIKKRDY